jgi:hypothetical protein
MSDDIGSRFDGLSSLIAFSGFTIPARARFITQCLSSSLFSGLTLGLVCGQAGAVLLPCGPLVPFMTGSWMGYTWGMVAFWNRSKTNMMSIARRYPRILSHSLLAEFDVTVPSHVNTDSIAGSKEESESDKDFGRARYGDISETSLEQWIVDGGIGRVSYAVLAAQSCREDVVEMQKNQRQKLIDAYT